MEPNPVKKKKKEKKPVFILLLFYYCGTPVYCESMAASLGPSFRTRATDNQITAISFTVSFLHHNLHDNNTLDGPPLSKALRLSLFSPFQHPNDSLPHLKMHLWGRNKKKSLGKPLKVKEATAETVHWHVTSQHAKCNECNKKKNVVRAAINVFNVWESTVQWTELESDQIKDILTDLTLVCLVSSQKKDKEKKLYMGF